ncbi:MAG: hypothetical protein KIG88_12360 [Weeksellaceae bacterium]|nr:hypothetical protein [Weeksellaceae bacterium]
MKNIRLITLLFPFIVSAKEVKVYAFVGELIEYRKVDYQEYYKLDKEKSPVYFDQMFVAKYKIIQPICNDFKSEIIEFVSFDHYGVPPMFKEKNPIVYLGFDEEKKEYFQYKYTWDQALFINNNWYGIFDYIIADFLENYKPITVRFPYAYDREEHERNRFLYPDTHFEINPSGQSIVTKVYDIYDLAEARIKKINSQLD